MGEGGAGWSCQQALSLGQRVIMHCYANYRADGSAYRYDVTDCTTPLYHPEYAYGGRPYSSPVGRFAPNCYGLYDMIGNMREVQ